MAETTVAIALKHVTNEELKLLLTVLKIRASKETGQIPTTSEILKMGIIELAKQKNASTLKRLFNSVRDEDVFTETIRKWKSEL